jgi:hypothetical protein
MSDSEPIAQAPFAAAPCTEDGVSWCWATTSAPASISATAACFSAGGSNHDSVQITRTSASGLT